MQPVTCAWQRGPTMLWSSGCHGIPDLYRLQVMNTGPCKPWPPGLAVLTVGSWLNAETLMCHSLQHAAWGHHAEKIMR